MSQHSEPTFRVYWRSGVPPEQTIVGWTALARYMRRAESTLRQRIQLGRTFELLAPNPDNGNPDTLYVERDPGKRGRPRVYNYVITRNGEAKSFVSIEQVAEELGLSVATVRLYMTMSGGKLERDAYTLERVAAPPKAKPPEPAHDPTRPVNKLRTIMARRFSSDEP